MSLKAQENMTLEIEASIRNTFLDNTFIIVLHINEVLAHCVNTI